MEICKTIIPAAGVGTRLLPATKAIPKEMLPLLDKPTLQHVIEEGLLSDIKRFIIVTSRHKESIPNHFDSDPELEHFLKEHNKSDLITSVERIIKHAEFNYIRQGEPRGLGHAIWTARHTIGKEYFGIMLPDDIILNKVPALSQLIRIARQEKANVIAVQEVPSEQVSSYGIIAVRRQISPTLFQVQDLVEKPSPKTAPSSLAVVGRYVLSHKIFASLETIEPSAGGELQLTDAIAHLIKNNEKVLAYKLSGVRHDTGTTLGWLKANIDMALHDPQYASHIRAYLQEALRTL